MGILFFLSHQQGLDTPSLFTFQDKVIHAFAYGVLGILLLVALPMHGGGYSWIQVRNTVLIASLYGASDELHQYFIPGRSTEIGDWVADSLGALLAATLLALLSRRMPLVRTAT